MKKQVLPAAVLLAGVLPLGLSGCNGNNGNDKAAAALPAAASADAPAGEAASLNIRYVDGDSISARYQGSIDLQAAHMRAMQRLDQAQQSKAAEIQRFAASIEQKGRNNGYLTQESYNADMAKLQKMQQDAESYLANLQRKTEIELAQQTTALNDSIDKIVKEFNKKYQFDAILFKNAGLYFNPALDITTEVVEALNASYKAPEEKK